MARASAAASERNYYVERIALCSTMKKRPIAFTRWKLCQA